MKFGEVIKELKIYPNKKFVNDNGVIMRRVENEIKYAAVNQSESDITLFGSGWWNSDWKEVKEDDWNIKNERNPHKFCDVKCTTVGEYMYLEGDLKKLKQKILEDLSTVISPNIFENTITLMIEKRFGF